MFTGPEPRGSECKNCLSAKTNVTDGWAEFFSPAESLSIWTKSDARGREEFKKD